MENIDKETVRSIRDLVRQKVLRATGDLEKKLTQKFPDGKWGKVAKALRENWRGLHYIDAGLMEGVINASVDGDLDLSGNYPKASAVVLVKNPNIHNYKLGEVVIVDETMRSAFGKTGCSGSELPMPDQKYVRAAIETEIDFFLSHASDDTIITIATMNIEHKKCSRQRRSVNDSDDEDEAEE